MERTDETLKYKMDITAITVPCIAFFLCASQQSILQDTHPPHSPRTVSIKVVCGFLSTVLPLHLNTPLSCYKQVTARLSRLVQAEPEGRCEPSLFIVI